MLADPGWALIWCRGSDAKSFLQGLLSADLEIPSGSVRRSFLLQPQGKLEALAWVLVGDDEVGLVVDEGVSASVLSILTRFRMRVDATLETSEAPVSLLVGSTMSGDGGWSKVDGGIVADVSRGGVARTIVIGDPPEASPMSDEAYLAHRIMLGEPVMGVDVGTGTIPQETGLVSEAVSFTKGCYLGQELVARIDSRGHVNQRLVRVEADSQLEPGDVVRFGDRASTITSATATPDGWAALAVVRREIPDGASVMVETAMAEVQGTVHDFPRD